ncbi:unnamed protein product [Diamesa serratosioi]
MDYQNYKAMCDSSLQKIQKSEFERQELNDKLQKMYQEKSDCEKSIIKTLHSQQKQFMEEKSRRAERNENILRTLDRIDYQGSVLAAKTDRLRTLKKQYEKYLISIWNTRRSPAYPITRSPKAISPFSSQYAGSAPSVTQQSYFDPREVQARVVKNHSDIHVAPQPSTFNYQHNPSYYNEMPSNITKNPIKINNYDTMSNITTGPVTTDPENYQFSLPFQARYRFDDSEKLQQPVERNYPYHYGISNNNIPYPNTPSTMNSIYSQQQSHILPFNITSTKTYNPLCQRNNDINQPPSSFIENCNFKNEELKVSSPYYNYKTFIQSTPPPPPPLSSTVTTAEQSLKNQSKIPNIIIHISDDDDDVTDDESNKINPMQKIRHNDTHHSTIDQKNYYEKTNSPIANNQFEKFNLNPKSTISYDNDSTSTSVINLKQPYATALNSTIEANANAENRRENITNDLLKNENLHQVWEKVVNAEPVVSHSSFVIPQIVVEPTTMTNIPAVENETQKKIEQDTPEQVFNQIFDGTTSHSSDNQNDSLSFQQPPEHISNNFPLKKETESSSIYHYDKMKEHSNEQQLQEPPKPNAIEHELRNFNEIQITTEVAAVRTPMMTIASPLEVETKTYISYDERNDGDENVEKEAINNINDQNVEQHQSTATVLNDKIKGIYEKIEKIEGDYYGEKVKIIEDFERKMTSSSFNDNLKAIEFEPTAMVVGSVEQTNDIEEVQPEVPEVIMNEFPNSHVLDQSIEKGNLIFKNNDFHEGIKNDLHQSEFITNEWNESQESKKPNYDYENYNLENQPNTQPTIQPYFDPEQVTDEYLDEQPQEINYNETANHFHQPEQYSTDNEYPNNSSDNQQLDYVEENIDENKLPDTEFSTIHSAQNENNYNKYNSQLDSNQHYETEQQPSNNDYTNDPSAVYDYDQSHHQTPQIIYDHQQQQQQEYNEFTAIEKQDDFNSNKVEFNNEILDDEHKNVTDIFEQEQYQALSNDTLKSTNYEMETVYDEGEIAEIDESLTTTTTASTSESIGKQKKSLDIENETKSNANEPIDNVAVEDKSDNALYETQQDDVKMVKHLLDSESDDNSGKSNLKQQANDEKENVDESDFDFSTS